MPLTDPEKIQIRFHLRYPLAQYGSMMWGGQALPSQSMFLLESNMGKIGENALPIIRRILQILDDNYFGMQVEWQEQLRADQLEELRLRPDAHKALRIEYAHHQAKLSQCLNVPINPDFSGMDEADGGNRNIGREF
jgi:hypothetical protein